MARKKHNELVTGIFVVLAVATTFGVIVWLGGADLFRPARQKAVFYVAEDQGSMGLIKGSFVQIGDDQVGKVDSIRFDPQSGRTLYTALIERGDFKVYSNGRAKVAAGLIGGARLIIVSRGDDSEPLADVDNPIELVGGLDQVMTQLAEATEKVNQIAGTIQSELDATRADAMLAKIHEIMNSLKNAAMDVAIVAANVKSETDRQAPGTMLAKFHSSMDDINEMTADAKPKVSDTLTAVRNTARKIEKYATEDVADILAKLREANTEILKITKDFSVVSGQARQLVMLHRDNIDEMIDNMTQVSANLKASSKEIRRNPWRLLYRPDDKELRSKNLYDAARAFAAGAEQLDQALSKMTGLAKASPEGIPADDPTLTKVRRQLEEAFTRFSKAEQALWKEISR